KQSDAVLALLRADVSASDVSGSGTVKQIERILHARLPTCLTVFPGSMDLSLTKCEEDVELDTWLASVRRRANLDLIREAHVEPGYLNDSARGGLQLLVNELLAKQSAAMPGVEVGESGFRVGYTETGDKVELLPDHTFPSGEPVLIRRS